MAAYSKIIHHNEYYNSKTQKDSLNSYIRQSFCLPQSLNIELQTLCTKQIQQLQDC